jgi:hypothetical protein
MTNRQIDWEAIERDYRIGQLSLSAIATKHGTTKGTVSKKAKAKAWVQDASQEVRERTRAAMLVQDRKKAEAENGNTVSKTGNAPTQVDIEVAVQTNLQVINRHRTDIAKGQGLVGLMFQQLQDAASDRAELEAIAEEVTAEDLRDIRYNRLMKAVSLQTHAGVLRDLSTALKNFIPLERQAFNLDEQEHEEPYETRLKRLLDGE